MAAPRDREDRAAATKAAVAKRVRVAKRKPMPMPDMEATLVVPHQTLQPAPKRVQRSVVFKPTPQPDLGPHGGHVPIIVERQPVLNTIAPAPARKVKAFNQDEEKQRRAALRVDRAARDARKAEVRKMPAEVRKMIGSDKLHEYIRTGAVEKSLTQKIAGTAEAIGGAAAHGVAQLPGAAAGSVADFTSHLSAGLQGRKSSPVAPEDNPLVNLAGQGLLGPNIVKALGGEDYDPKWLIGEMALLAVPIKGLPTPLSAALRAAVGATKLARAERAGMTVAEVLTRPISEVRAASRASLVAKAADQTITGPIPSSRIAGKLAGDRTGRVARIIRNDVRSTRKFTVGDATVETAADLSRTGKAVRAVMDKIRDGRLVPLRSTDTMFARTVGKQAVQHANRAAGLEKALSMALPRGVLHNVDWPGMYAVRTVAKGVPIEDAIRVTEKSMLDAKAAGDWLGEQANKAHLGFFKAAEKYVTTDAAGNPVFRPDAPAQLEQLRSALENVSLEREKILSGLDKLSDETMKGRILKEQLHYAEATMMPKNDWIAQRLQEHPIRKQLASIWFRHNPAQAPNGLMLQDAAARRWYEQKLGEYDARIAETEGWLAQHPTGPLNVRHRRDLEQLKQERDHLDPATYYSEIHQVSDTLPPDIIEKLSEHYGEFGKDWRFSIVDQPHPFSFGEKMEATNLKRAINTPHFTPANERMLDEHGIPIVGAITPEEMARRLVLATPTAEQRAHDASFYHNLDQVFGKVMRDEEIMAWLASQVGASPARGVLDLLKVQDKMLHGEVIGPNDIGLAARTMEKILKGETGLTQGAKAKISDFIDSALLKDTRQWVGNDPRGGTPFVIDRWGIRANGGVDGEGAQGIIKQRWGIDVASDTTAKGGITPTQYEAIRKSYEEFRAYLNDVAFDGRSDWSSQEIQAMDWAAIQRYWGTEPEDLKFALDRETRRIDFEVTQGPMGLGADLTPEQAAQVAARMQEHAVRLAADSPGVTVRDVFVDTGGWAGGHNATINLEVLGLEKDVQPLITKIAQAFDQELVQASRWVTVNKGDYPSKAALIVRNPAFSDPRVKQEFFQRLAERHPELGGYTAAPGGADGFVSRTSQGNLTATTKATWPTRFAPAIKDIEQEMGLSPSTVSADNLQLLIGSQHGPAAFTTEPGTVGGITDLAGLDPAAAEVRTALQSDLGGANLHASLFGDSGEVADGAEVVLRGKGEEEAAKIAGYDEAVASLARQEIPTDFIEAVVNSPLHIYDKIAVGRHLDSLAGGTLRGRDFPGIPGAKAMFPETLQLAGLWEGVTRSLYFSEKAHPIDWIHEWTHAMETADMFPPAAKAALWRHVGADEGAKLTHDQSEDVADLVNAVILGFDPAKSDLPKSVQSAMISLQKAMKKDNRGFTREHAALAKLPEEERIFLEDIFTFEGEEGVHFTGGFKPKPGQYVPEKLGMPFRFGNPLAPRRAATHWLRLLGGKRVVTLTPTDKHLTHEFKGELLRSGRWEKNVIEGPLEGLLKAYNLQRMADVHAVMVQAGRHRPVSADDVMIPLDPKAWTDKTRAQARSVIEILNSMDTGTSIDKLALDKTDAQAIEAIKDFMFPGMTDSSAAAVADIARRAMAEPIEGVVWVDRNLLLKTGLFQPASAKTPAVKYAVAATDDINNIMKMMTLSLNPAYYPMNMAGQAIMLGSQLSFSAPFSLAKSLAQARRLSEEDLALIDRFADIGYAGSFLSKGGALKQVTDTVGKVGTILIDKYPRRFSFLHEARRLGYRSDEQIHALVNDIDKFDDLMKVHERVQRAMVDYGNLNRFEKEYLTRLIFVYPWLRGSSRYAAQFPFDHPIQAALFAGLVYWQQNRIREAFPQGHPGFMKWYMPLDIPKDGENPYGFRMDQLATPLQTLDLAAMMTYWGSGGKLALPWGSNEEGMGSMLGPFAEEIEKTITGYDSFTRQQISHGIPQLFTRILDPRERWASWTRLNKILQHETHKGLYDTNQTQNWLRLFLGSLAPMDVDVSKAGDMSAGVGTLSPAQSRDKYIAKVEEINGEPLPPEVKAQISQWKAADQAYRKVSREYRDEHEIEGDSTIQERAAMLLLTVAEINPDAADEARRRAELALTVSDEEAQAAYDELRQALGLTRLATLDGRLRKAQLEKRTVTP